MKKFIIVFLILLSVNSYSQKLVDAHTFNHWTAGATVGGIVSANFGKSNNHRIMLGVVSGLVVGTLKEVVDNSKSRGSVDFGDIIATTSGGLIGGLISNAAIRKSKQKKKEKKIKVCKM